MSDALITKDEKILSLNKLLTSNVFKSESAYRKVLNYYLESIRKDEDVDFSETSIALDALEKDVEFNPYYDSSVRVAMHRLRNNLVNYYSLEGKGDSVKIHIPIGDYNPFFYKEKESNDSVDYCLQLMKAVTFKIEHTLHEDSIKLHQYVIKNNAECLTAKYNHYYSCSIPFNILHYPLVLNAPLPIEEEELESLVENVFNKRPKDHYSLLLKAYYSLFLKKYEESYEYAKRAYEISHNMHLKGIALVFQIFSGFFEDETVRRLEELQMVYTQHPPYWFVANMIVAIDKGDLVKAFDFVQRFHSVPSRLSSAFYLLMKRNMTALTEEDELYINENPSDFSEGFLGNFLSSVLYRLI